MGTTSSTLQGSSSSTPHFQLIFEKALKEYKQKTGKDLTTHPLAAEINGCASPEAILAILEAKARELDQSQSGDERLTKWLNPTVKILNALSAILGQDVGTVFPPTKIIFSGIGILLVAAKSTLANRDMLVELFERIESFFKRIKTYTEVAPSPELTDALAKILAKVLSILATATKGMTKKQWKIFLKQLAGMNDIGDALQRFGKLEQGELLTVIAQMSTDTRLLKDDAKEIKADAKETKADMKETKAEVREFINKMDMHKRENFLRDLKAWLSPPEPSTNYKLGIHAYHKGTTTWFIEGNVFQEWDSTGSLLWIHGKPGSGKSILCSAIIQRLLSLSDGGRASVAYFYFDFRDEEKKHRHNLLPSLLIQLAEQSITCSDILSPVYSAHGNGKQPPSDDVLMGCLKDMLSASPQHPMYIILDAVDECPDSSGVLSARAQVLSFIQEILELRLANLHICITSRPEIDIRNRLEPLTSLRVSLHDEPGHKEDIAKYIRFATDFISQDKRWRDGDKELVIETLSGKADGMFRWVFCQLEMLRLCIRSRVRHFVNALPDGLDETYERVLKGIPKTNQLHVQRVLQCLAMAIRPLRVDELAQILTFDPDGVMLDADSPPEDQEQELLSACPSLITIVDNLGSRVVQFSHFSVKEFLMSGRLSISGEDISHYHIIPDAAHTSLAQASLGILLCLDDRVDRWRARNTPLAAYAAEHWVSHVQVANPSSPIMRMMEVLFDFEKPHFAAWVRIYDMDKPHWYLDRATATPLYYAALCGFPDLVEHLVKKHPGHANTLGGQHDYPLVAALYKGHIQVANLLLQHGANMDGRGTYGQTPLHHAITRFNETVLGAVRFLLEHGAHANSQQFDLRTPLHLAAAWGNDKFMSDPAPILNHTNLVELLLEYGANIHAEDRNGGTPLHQVVEGNFISEEGSSVVRLLLERGADVNKPGKDLETPLHLASLRQHIKTVQVLLDHGANVNAKGWQGKTPLHRVFAGIFVHEESSRVVQLFVERGADVNRQDENHVTPLHSASGYHKLESVQVLLDNGANVNAEDSLGLTPLHYLLHKPDTSDNDVLRVVQLLVDRGAGVNIKDKDHMTPLHFASFGQKLESVRVLLDHGANVDAEDNHGRTPLHRVLAGSFISEDGVGVVRLLLERGTDVNTPNKDRVTPLHLASYRQKLEPVRVLLNHGANVNAEDSHHRTPLHRVLEGRFLSKDGFGIVQLLVEHGADVNTKDKDHITPLHFASYRSKLESVRVLLNHGANVNVEDSHHRTPLHRALERTPISEDGFGVVQLLVERGASVNTRDKGHITPLHCASFNQHLESVQILVNHGANVNAKDNMGQTPLHDVVRNPDVSKDGLGVVQLLLERSADVNTPNKDHITPLHFASYYQRLESVRVLLDHGANVHAKDDHDKTPFHRVLDRSLISEDGLGAVQLLAEHGADVNPRDKDHATPLHVASNNQNLELVRVLLDHGANGNAEDGQGWTPLHHVFANPVASKDVLSVVQLLLERGADVNIPNKDHIIPLHTAAYRRHLESARVLLDHGANVNAEDSQGWTPLNNVFANPGASKDVLGVVQLLLERGADVNTPNKDHITPLHMASYRQHLESARLLLDHEANVHAEDSQGRAPLLAVLGKPDVSKDVLSVVQLLLERGADVNARNKDHLTPLHLASSRQHVELVRVLLDHGANVNAKDHYDQTPLHQTVESTITSEDGFGVVRQLVERGADVNAQGKNHSTPLHFASYNQHFESVRLLLSHGANVNAKNNWGQTPLHRVFDKPPEHYSGKHVVPQLLLKHGADVNARDEVHETPLHLAVRFGWFEGPWVLLEHGADLSLENKRCMTPSQLVRKKMREEMKAALPGYFYSKQMIAQRVVLLSLLYE